MRLHRLTGLFAAAGVLHAALGGCGRRVVDAERPKQEILLIGDSIAAGVGVTSNRHSLQGRLAGARPNWFIFNVSRGGMTVAGGSALQPFVPKWIAAGGRPPVNVVVMLGVNDFITSVPLDTFRARYYAITVVAKNLGRNLVCVTPIWMGDENTPNRANLVLADYRKAITEVCTSRGFAVIDGENLVPHDPSLYAADKTKSLHPNAEGYRWLAEGLTPQLDGLLLTTAAAQARTGLMRRGGSRSPAR